MSRCFPFPPPGFEKEARSGDAEDLLKKEKHKERKHKKEKKDKEKRKDKDRSKDKHKEKKDKKEKHKDKTKDKDKNKKAEDTRTEIRSETRHDTFGQVAGSKFTEEFGRRIRDEERGALGQSVGNFTTTTQKRVEPSIAAEKESVNRKIPDQLGSLQRRNENLTHPVERRTEGIGTGFSIAKQRVASSETLQVFTSPEPGKNRVNNQRLDTNTYQTRSEGTVVASSLHEREVGRNNIPGQNINNMVGSGQRRNEALLTSNSIQKERGPNNNVNVQKSMFTSNSIQKERGAVNKGLDFIASAQRKYDGMGPQAQNLSFSIQKSTQNAGIIPAGNEKGNNIFSNVFGGEQRKNDQMDRGMGNHVPRIEKEAVKSSYVFPNTTFAENRTNDHPVDNFSEKKKEKKSKESKREKHKDRDRSEKKSKRKEKDRHKEKEKEEKIKEKIDDKRHKHDEPQEIKNTNQVDNITKAVAPPVENPNLSVADGISRKRKEIEINGFLHETDERPNKLPRTTPFPPKPTLLNGKTLNLSHTPLHCSIKLDTINKPKTEISCNGKAEVAQPSLLENGKISSKVSSRPPHPDTKYLSTVYSIPKHDQWPETNDQDWLFKSKDSKSLMKLEEDEVNVQVWARGMQIESADIFALPYVVPY